MMKHKRSAYDGLQDNVPALKTPEIEIWHNKYPENIFTVVIEIPEFTSICPKTGLPDFAHIRIEYSPEKYCLELKSLKMYTVFFRDVGIFHEHLANKMLDDLVKACEPRWLKLTSVFNPRGGIATTVVREYKRE
jgi:7-cyano-7-deazaguanine reductase